MVPWATSSCGDVCWQIEAKGVTVLKGTKRGAQCAHECPLLDWAVTGCYDGVHHGGQIAH